MKKPRSRLSFMRLIGARLLPLAGWLGMSEPRKRLRLLGGRLFTLAGWLGGWALLSWALADAIGPAGWKLGGGLGLIGSAGLRPLSHVIRSGAAIFPPWDMKFEPDEKKGPT